MPVSMTGTPRSTPPLATTEISKTFDTQLQVAMSGVSSSDLGSLYLAIGQHAGAPTLYSQLSASDVGSPVDAVDWTTYQSTQPFGGTTASVTVSGKLLAANFSAWTPGVQAWFALFNTTNPPSAGDVPIAVVGPFSVVA